MTIIWSLALTLGGTTDALLYLAPALLLALPLAFGRYLGEEKLAELSERLRRKPPRPAAAPAPLPRAVVTVARGGRLIASSLAGRGPPPPITS